MLAMQVNQSRGITKSARFWSKVARGAPDACWLWMAYRLPKGYGQFWDQGRMRRAHVVSVELSGRAIAPGWEIDHECKNKSCVNPAHLRIVPPGWNGGQSQRETTQCPSGHPYRGDNLYVGPQGARVCKACDRRRSRDWKRTHRAALRSGRAAYGRIYRLRGRIARAQALAQLPPIPLESALDDC